MSGSEPDRPRGHEATERAGDRELTYEWEILIEAPLAFDFFKLVRALFRLPRRISDGRQRDGKSWRRYILEVLIYNVGLISLILLMIPFLMLAFSYLATLPFLVLRLGASALGPRAMAVVSLIGLIATLTVPVVLILLMVRPEAYRDAYKRSKIELFNILIALSLFLAGGMMQSLIASPVLPLRNAFEATGNAGALDSTMQWTLYFADRAMNVLFANLPQKIFGPLAEIREASGVAGVSLGLLRTLLLFGFLALLRLGALKYCFSKKELFYGTVEQLRAYLDYCGKAEARTVRRVIAMPDEDVIVVRNKHRSLPAPPPASQPGPPDPQVAEVR